MVSHFNPPTRPFLLLWPFNLAPHAVVTSNHTTIFAATSFFVTVMNRNITIFGDKRFMKGVVTIARYADQAKLEQSSLVMLKSSINQGQPTFQRPCQITCYQEYALLSGWQFEFIFIPNFRVCGRITVKINIKYLT